jgi:predicted nucleic acid-binding protein
MYLLDTNFVSELRRPQPNPTAFAWAQGLVLTEAYLSALTIGELVKGAERIKEQRPVEHGSLMAWIESIENLYQRRILAITAAISRRYGFLAKEKPLEQKCGQIDILLAATAIEHGLTIVTRNAQHFSQLRVPFINPWLSGGFS